MKIITQVCIITGLLFVSVSAYSLSIFQGPTSKSVTSFNILVPAQIKPRIEVKNGAKILEFKKENFDLSPIDDWKIIKVYTDGLELNKKYELNIYTNDQLVDQRFFRAYDRSALRSKLLIASCLDSDYPNEQAQTWSAVQKQDPDAIFLIGDNTYADRSFWDFIFKWTSKKQLVQKHIESRNLLGLYQYKNLVPLYTVWDDHDYGMNDGGRDFELKEFSQKLFAKMWNSFGGEFISKGPGVAYFTDLYDVRYFFLDGRSFRDTKNAQGDHLGQQQIQWIKNNSDFNGTLAFIKGDQFYGAYHSFESYEGNHPKEFKQFEELLRNLQSPFFLVSGDRHLTEIIDLSRTSLKLRTFELTSSGAHAKLYPGTMENYKNPAQFKGSDGTLNFMTLEFKGGLAKRFRAKSLNEKGKLLYDATLRPAN